MIGKILPDYPNANVASKVKVRHLLSHTGGTGDIFGPEFQAHRLELKTLQDYVKLYGERDLQFDPGAKWEYSNYGFLKAETLAEATRPQFATGAYGFGFQIGRRDEARTYGHGGGAPGMNAVLRVYPESGQAVIVLCNLDSPSASRMGDWLHARMPLK